MRGKQTIYGKWKALFNDRLAAKTTIDFLVKHTAQLKVQLIKGRLQSAVVDLDMLRKLGNMRLPAPIRELHDFILSFFLITAVGDKAT